jgi:hypothetical protein
MFGSEDEGFQFYNNYALEKGSSVQKSYVEWDNDNHDLLNLRKFVCSREGFRESKYMKNGNRKRKARNISRVGCRARLVVAQVKEQDGGMSRISLMNTTTLWPHKSLLVCCGHTGEPLGAESFNCRDGNFWDP